MPHRKRPKRPMDIRVTFDFVTNEPSFLGCYFRMHHHVVQGAVQLRKSLAQGRRGRCRGLGVHQLEAWAQNAGIRFGDEQGPAAPLGGQDIPMMAGQFLQRSLAHQPPQVVAHPAGRVPVGRDTREPCHERAQRAVGQPIRERDHRDQRGQSRAMTRGSPRRKPEARWP